ncbi:MAG: DNA-3-methyladenine glycosylase [Thaumarchaeota archaeon]|nr:MAG: DNA-3-methyladenine glycosylase [Nitrososphaerota archaeon]TLX94946.1 MAG: DNA-3-methyladenine glycosylase [Nitrososphaerota archaeon]
MKIIPRSFYQRNTVDVAQALLGQVLVRRITDKIISGVIVETEAYRYRDDAASHSFMGRTERNRAMFEEVGRAYVYFTYGMHFCVNVVARDNDSEAGAVLLRALVPKKGLDFMVRQRKTKVISNLTNGPAKLTQALRITNEQYGEDLTRKSSLYIIEGKKVTKSDIDTRPRIGIKKATDKLWNFRI